MLRQSIPQLPGEHHQQAAMMCLVRHENGQEVHDVGREAPPGNRGQRAGVGETGLEYPEYSPIAVLEGPEAPAVQGGADRRSGAARSRPAC